MNAASLRVALESLADKRLGMLVLTERPSGVVVPRVAGGGQRIVLEDATGCWLAYGALSIVCGRVETLVYDQDAPAAARAVARRVAERVGACRADAVLARAELELQEVS